MAVSKKAISDFVSTPGFRPVRIKELARQLKVKAGEYRSFRRLVKEMTTSGKLARLKGGRIGPPERQEELYGDLSITRGGTGFIIRDFDPEDVLVPGNLLGGALRGDLVRFKFTGRFLNGKRVGRILEVKERKQKQIVGTFHSTRFGATVTADDPRVPFRVNVSLPKGKKINNGLKVVVRLDPWRDPALQPSGRIVQILGRPDDPGVDILSIIHQHGLATDFPAAVEREADKFDTKITVEESSRRRDLRRKVLFTIDPADAKDHDDAVSLERTRQGFRLGVHIADVSHYVAAGSRLDREARARCFSAYLADRVLPMLPERLSNDLCSLREKEDRLAISLLVEIDEEGNPLKHELVESIIRSQARLSYEEVQEYLDSGAGFERRKRIGSALKLMEELAERLIQRRKEAGSLDLELPEYKVVLGEDGSVAEIRKRVRRMSHRIIEEFMLLANRVVAYEFLSRNIPTLYRVHPPPDEEKLASFALLARSLGLKPSFGSPPQINLIAKFIDDLRSRPESEFLSELLVRSMQKALYQPDNVGHFGLGFPYYLHFTSPIRRYPDLMVHRLLRQLLNREYRPAGGAALKGSLKRIGKHCFEQEVTIMDAEMSSLRVKQAEYLSRQLGEVFPGVISGVLMFGFFVRLVDSGAEGMVRLSSLEDDYYTADLEKYTVTGRRSGRRLRLGDKVMVQIVNVSQERGEIDLQMIEDRRTSRPGGRTGRSRRKRRK